MSHYLGSSYRPGGGDLYRPNGRQNYDGNGPANGGGFGSGRPGDRNPGMRQNNYNSGRNFRPPQSDQGYNSHAPNERRFQGNQNNYNSQPQGNSYHGYQKAGQSTANTVYNTPDGYGSKIPTSQSHGSYNNYGNSSSNSYKPGYNSTNQASMRQGHYKPPFQQKKPTDSYHQAYQQTQAESQLWMGDLDPRWTEGDIMAIWNEVGESPKGVKIIRDKMGKPQYSFVTFASQENVTLALQKNRAQIPGSPRVFKLNWASGSSHADPRAPAARARGVPDAGRGVDYSLFVGDLATEVTEPELFNRFNQDFPGEVKQVKIMMDQGTGSSKGFGFVRFLSVESQQKALKTMNGIVLGQRAIRLGLANGSLSSEPSTSTVKKSDALSTVHIAQYQPPLSPFTDPYNTTIAMKGVILAITRDELIAHFLPFGNIVYCRVDHTDQLAHVKYLERGSAQRALLFMHGQIVNGSRLVLRWGREKVTPDGKVRFSPVPKGGLYFAAEKLPPVFGSLPTNVVFEDLNDEQIASLDFKTGKGYVSVLDLNKKNKEAVDRRQSYLENAF